MEAGKNARPKENTMRRWLKLTLIACISACLPARLAGGLIAGAIIAVVVRRRNRPAVSWASASTIAALTGALGCACVGLGSLLAVAAGLLLGATPLVLRPARGGT
jgi:uncharacterized membrane protein YbhN (UPF0104 family)